MPRAGCPATVHPARRRLTREVSMAQSVPAGKAGRLIQAALDLHQRFGWCVIPARGKKPAGRWKQYQRRRQDEDELRRLFAPPGVTGLAVILGPVSGGLVCRDFDTADGYRVWAQRYPE